MMVANVAIATAVDLKKSSFAVCVYMIYVLRARRVCLVLQTTMSGGRKEYYIDFRRLFGWNKKKSNSKTLIFQ